MVDGIGPVRAKRLLERFPGPDAVFRADKRSLEEVFGIGPELAGRIMDAKAQKDLEGELALMGKKGVRAITLFDRDYPKILREIHDPPLVLYVKGQILEEDEFAIGVVGSRHATPYGLKTARKFGYELASRGVVVVSGLARGIDTAAHEGALKACGRTIAVLGNGLNTVYPPENEGIAEKIIECKGAVVSEFPMTAGPIAKNFPRRNRVISGLSIATVVVEAAKNSGALITADFALEQGRDVFAVPGAIDSDKSFGTNELIKQGARLAQCAEDVVCGLGLALGEAAAGGGLPQGAKRADPPEAKISADEAAVYKNLSDTPKYLDEIAQGAEVCAQKAMELLFKLQFKKLARELPGKNFVRV